MTKVINISSLSHAQKDLLLKGELEGYVYVGRSVGNVGVWGNKYSHKPSSVRGTVMVGSLSAAIQAHRAEVLETRGLVERIRQELRGKTLVCWCWPAPCHANTLAQIADEYRRAGGGVECECSKLYREHPAYMGELFEGQPFLIVLCNGELVKL